MKPKMIMDLWWDKINSPLIMFILGLFVAVLGETIKNYFDGRKVACEKLERAASLNKEISLRLRKFGEVLINRDKNESGSLMYRSLLYDDNTMRILQILSDLGAITDSQDRIKIEAAQNDLMFCIVHLSSRGELLYTGTKGIEGYLSSAENKLRTSGTSHGDPVGYITDPSGQVVTGHAAELEPRKVWKIRDRNIICNKLLALNLNQWDFPFKQTLKYFEESEI